MATVREPLVTTLDEVLTTPQIAAAAIATSPPTTTHNPVPCPRSLNDVHGWVVRLVRSCNCHFPLRGPKSSFDVADECHARPVTGSVEIVIRRPGRGRCRG